MRKSKKPSIAVCGVGYWGKNLAKHFHQLGVLKGLCEVRRDLVQSLDNQYPGVPVHTVYSKLLKDPSIDAIALAVPTIDHYAFAKKALLAKKHVFVEKPIALKKRHAEELCRIARRVRKKLMVGHLLLYHPAVRKMKQLVKKGTLGKTYYLYTQRLNLGQIRKDENALWSLAPHDISIILELFDAKPTRISAKGHTYIQSTQGIEDVIFMHFEFKDGRSAHVHLSWLDPHKVRRITLVGSKKMVVFDDMEKHDKLRLYDKGAVSPLKQWAKTSFRSVPIRVGEVRTLPIDPIEPLKAECAHFVDAIRLGKEPHSNGKNGVEVLKLLELATQSLKKGGKVLRV